jgi:hypothetical protein
MSDYPFTRSFVVAGLLASFGLLAATHQPTRVPEAAPARVIDGLRGVHPDTPVTSTNWAGYVEKGHTFNYVHATWTVPAVSCSKDDAVASFWVGIDGYGDKTVEQAGTLGFCHNGKVAYRTWWEMYPATGMRVVGSTVKPGDSIAATVTVSGDRYTLKVVDSTHPASSFTKKATCRTCRNASAEWIAERPVRSKGLFPLAKFGHLRFYESRLGFGRTRGYAGRYAHDSVTMTNRKGNTLAAVSGLRHDGKRFVTTWRREQ